MRRLAYLLALLAGLAAAQAELEILQLRNRSAPEVIPLLEPLLEPGGVMTGQGYQLIVRTSPRNLAEIRAAAAALDRPLRRLVISVRHGAGGEERRHGAGAQVELRSGDSRAAVRILDSASAAQERIDQRVQVIEGARAWIAAGESRPAAEHRVLRTPDGRVIRETVVAERQAVSGFEVVARLAGDSVHLEIAPQRQAFAPSGALRTERASTVVRARLGEWIEIGGAATAAAASERGILSSREASASATAAIWVKVEEAPN